MEFVFFLLLFTFFLFFFMLVKRGTPSKTPYPNAKLPPGPSKLPLIGSLHHLLGGVPHRSLRDLAKKYGPLMHLQLGEVSAVVISSPRIAKEVMKTHDLVFANRYVVFAANVVTYGCRDMVFAPYGEFWRQLRKICILELLSAKRVQSFQSLREEEVSNLIQNISSMEGSAVNFTHRIFTLTNDITARATFGKKCKDKDAFISMMDEAIRLASGFSVVDLFPSLKLLHVISGLKPTMERIHRKIDEILEGILKDHKESRQSNMPKNDEHEEDLVDVLLRLLEDEDLGFPITTINIKAVLLDIFTAGSETSSTTIDWAMSEMLKNPRVMEKAQAEVRQVLNKKKTMKETDIHELNYLKLVIKETLRLHPPLPLLIPRECREKCEIDGYEIPLNTKVIVNDWAIGRDPKHWSDAENFVPERFDGVSVDYKGTNFEFIPFGAGRRICPGIFFGVANIELPFAQLLYHFDWKLPNGIKSEELDMTESFGATVRRGKDLYLIATPYQSFYC